MKITTLLGVLALIGASAEAQETTGDIRGRVVSASGTPVVGATLIATGTDLLGARRVSSADDGVFQFLALPPGVYSIRVTALGYRPAVIDSVRVQLGRMEGLPETRLEATSTQLSEV
jgi:hypothetical protein